MPTDATAHTWANGTRSIGVALPPATAAAIRVTVQAHALDSHLLHDGGWLHFSEEGAGPSATRTIDCLAQGSGGVWRGLVPGVWASGRIVG